MYVWLPPRLGNQWESLQVTVVHNTFSNRVGTTYFRLAWSMEPLPADARYPTPSIQLTRCRGCGAPTSKVKEF
eukprot:scaffold34503_cov129-Isochrysis_galbana.AAC.1